MQNQSLKRATISGLFWSFSGLIGNQGVQFVIQITLARLLTPEDFGIIGMTTVFIAVAQSIADCGFGNALIREKNTSQEDYSTVFYFSFLVSLLLYIILFFSANAISIFFREPQLTLIIRVISLILIINSFYIIQISVMNKNLQFKAVTKILVFSSLLSGIIAIICAYNGFGVWSLVIRIVSMQLIQCILVFIYNFWLPSLVFRMDAFKRLYGFGWKLMASGVIDTMYQNLYYLIIGKAFSATELGYYSNAQKLRDIASSSISNSVQKVSYPVLSKIKDEHQRLRQGYRKMIRSVVFVTFPLMLGITVAAEPIIITIFGHKWFNSISYFQILCLAGMLFPLHALNLDILQVVGRTDLFLKLEVIKKVLGFASIGIVLFLNFGISGLLWVAVITSYISYFINSYYSAELISYSTSDQIKDIAPIFICSIIMTVIVFICGRIIPASYIVKLIIEVIVGIISYILVCKLFKIKELEEIQDIIKIYTNKLRRRGKSE